MLLNVVFLVIITHGGFGSSESIAATTIPQANWSVCSRNATTLNKRGNTNAYCVTGVLPKN